MTNPDRPTTYAYWAVRLERIGALSAGERGVLGMVGRGLENKEIVFELNIAQSSLTTFLSRIRAKLVLEQERSVVIVAALWLHGHGRIEPKLTRPCCFSPRQEELLALLGEGVDNGTIEQRLELSPTGVEKHIRAIRDILGIHRRRELVIYAAVRRWGPAQQAAPASALGSPHALKEWRFG